LLYKPEFLLKSSFKLWERGPRLLILSSTK